MDYWVEVEEEGNTYYVNEDLGNIIKISDGMYVSCVPKIIYNVEITAAVPDDRVFRFSEVLAGNTGIASWAYTFVGPKNLVAVQDEAGRADGPISFVRPNYDL